jgi:hypothetical protein
MEYLASFVDTTTRTLYGLLATTYASPTVCYDPTSGKYVPVPNYTPPVPPATAEIPAGWIPLTRQPACLSDQLILGVRNIPEYAPGEVLNLTIKDAATGATVDQADWPKTLRTSLRVFVSQQ